MPAVTQSSHSFEWRPDSIVCRSWRGHADAPTASTLIHSWVYTGPDIPPPGNERMRFNLYLYGGDAPVSGLGDEVIVTTFEYSE